MDRKLFLILVGIALLFVMELGYSVAIHNETRVGTLARKEPFVLQGPVTATLSKLTHPTQ